MPRGDRFKETVWKTMATKDNGGERADNSWGEATDHSVGLTSEERERERIGLKRRLPDNFWESLDQTDRQSVSKAFP